MNRSGGQVVADCLAESGVSRIFCVPGESYLAVLEGLYQRDDIDLHTAKHEGGAAIMAEAYAKATGKVGICMVTRGPGATNASAGVHIAFQDSTPMILFIGQVARGQLEREAFQEIDYRRMFGQMAKWVVQIDCAERIPEFINRAMHTATAGRPGPVVLALPEDMLTEEVVAPHCPPIAPVVTHPGSDDLDNVVKRLSEAKRPLAIVGGSGWDEQARLAMQTFAESFNVPVAAAFRFQDHFDNTHSNYIGDVGLAINPKLAQRVKDADLLLVIGARLGESTTGGYSLLEVPFPSQSLIHIFPDANELDRVYHADIAIASSIKPALLRLVQYKAPTDCLWKEWLLEARQHYLDHIQTKPMQGNLNLSEVISGLSKQLPENTVICNGAGNYAIWLHRFFQYKRTRTQLAPTCGSMGYGLPAAIAAKLTDPEKLVVCFAGDGCFQMTLQELGTAVQYGANIIVIVVNNGSYGTIRMHQEKTYPGHVIATELVNPDFTKLAQAYGAYGERVTHTNDFWPAFERAKSSNKPSLLELVIDNEVSTPNATISDLRNS